MPIDPDVEAELNVLRTIIAETSASLQNQINKLAARITKSEVEEVPPPQYPTIPQTKTKRRKWENQ